MVVCLAAGTGEVACAPVGTRLRAVGWVEFKSSPRVIKPMQARCWCYPAPPAAADDFVCFFFGGVVAIGRAA